MSWISKLFKTKDRTSEHGNIIYQREVTVNDLFWALDDGVR